jgi:UDP-GlcNAc:undecaprenyl-phosphate GlcNAc-1-phosphate transferase
MTILILSVIIINLSFYLLNYKLANLLNLYDYPDKIRKFHKNKVPLTGGVIIFSNVVFFYFFSQFNKELELFKDFSNLNIFFFSCCVLWFMGFIDDKINIPPNLKFIILLFVILVNISLDQSILIESVHLSFYNSFSLGIFSYIWTLICFLLFINALNLFDGINLQTFIYSSLISIIFILNSYLVIFFLTIQFSLLVFGLLNLNNKSFMGDNGTYLIAFIFSYFFIKSYNDSPFLYADEIVLIMLIPGLDLLRLFITRISKKKNPFSSDRNHLHHFLLNHYTHANVILIIHSLIILPFFLSQIFEITLYLILLQSLIYFYLIFKYKN